MTKIYESRIDAYHDHDGQLSPILVEFGTDLVELLRRQAPHADQIALDDKWSSHLDGKGFSVRILDVQYEARIEEITLVC